MYGNSITVSFDASRVEAGIEKLLNRKIEEGLSSDVQYQAAEIYKDLIEPYVPLKSGNLRDSANIVHGAKHALWGIEYDPISPKGRHYHYGQYQYFGDPSWDRTTPGTYDHWNQHLSRADREGFKQAVKSLVIEAMNDE